jgi:hypothetical protein
VTMYVEKSVKIQGVARVLGTRVKELKGFLLNPLYRLIFFST